MPDDFTLTPVDHDPFDLSEQADLSHTLGWISPIKERGRTKACANYVAAARKEN
jgi:hypothetical protein